jgi:transposase-like protein
MIPHLFFYQLAVLGLLGLFVMLHSAWPSRCATAQGTPAKPIILRCQRSKEPKPFAGLTHKPSCALCEHETAHPQPRPPVRPDSMPPTNRRPRVIETSMHFCPHDGCDYRGWLGLGNLRHRASQWWPVAAIPRYGLHRLLAGASWHALAHGKRVSVALMVRVLACVAEGLGIRATARVFEVDPNTVLGWLVEAAEHLKALSRYFLCDVHVRQLQLDELYAVLRAVKDDELGEAEAIQRLERSPHWVWTAMDPDSKLLLVMDVGPRTLAMAQCVVHQVVLLLAPDSGPLFLTDGLKEYGIALLTHFGSWMQPERRQAKGPTPKPRWMPLPQLLYAQVVKA